MMVNVLYSESTALRGMTNVLYIQDDQTTFNTNWPILEAVEDLTDDIKRAEMQAMSRAALEDLRPFALAPRLPPKKFLQARNAFSDAPRRPGFRRSRHK